MVRLLVKGLLTAGVVAGLTIAMHASGASESGEPTESRRDPGGHGPGCSNASLHGSFGFTSVGTLLALPAPFAGPFGEIGLQRFDGDGNTDFAATLSANGNINRVSGDGTYVVNPDCTGSMTLHVLPFNSTVNLDFVIDDDGTELRAIVTGTGVVETRIYKKQVTRGRSGE